MWAQFGLKSFMSRPDWAFSRFNPIGRGYIETALLGLWWRGPVWQYQPCWAWNFFKGQSPLEDGGPLDKGHEFDIGGPVIIQTHETDGPMLGLRL